MARRSPSAVRADVWYPRLDQPVALPSGLSPRGVAAIIRLERTRFWAGAAHQALQAWTMFLRDPYHRCFDRQYGSGELLCCPDPVELRSMLDTITHALPPRDARMLRRRLAAIDDQR
jgi:hypothetical protein